MSTEHLRTAALILQVAEARYWIVAILRAQDRINNQYGVDSREAQDCQELVRSIEQLTPQQCVSLSRAKGLTAPAS